MDPHTARCLQLSTSINMPFNPYRPHRYPDSVNRSRFPVNASHPQMRAISSSQMQSKGWPTPIIQNVMYQNPYTPQHTPQSGPIHQKPYIPAIHTSSSSKIDVESPFSQACFTPYDHFSNDPWSAGIVHTPSASKASRNNGLGLDFVDQDFDLTPTTLSGTTTESFEDLVRLDDLESWNFNPASPDRRSSSSLSASSGDVPSELQDFPELCQIPPLNSHLSSSLGIGFNASSPVPKPVETTLPRQNARGPSHHRHRHSTHSYRTSPYTVSRVRSSSMSTVPLSMPRAQCCSPLAACHEDFELRDADYQLDESTPSSGGMFDPSNNDIGFFFPTEPVLAPKPQFTSEPIFMSPNFQDYRVAPPVLPSSGFFDSAHDRCNEKNGDHYNHDLADEPDLFGPLAEEQIPPPEEDMKPEDPDLEPRSQELRFEGDLYTPQYVRGHGNKREGWCGICKPGRWLVLKNSAFWYDKSFTHGISAATGLPFEGPRETRRMSGNPDVWEGLCGSCGDWIALISSKKKGTTWFRHAYKCHTHQKAKDTPKRRREPAQNRVTKSYKIKKPKQDSRGHSPVSLGSPIEFVEPEPILPEQAQDTPALQHFQHLPTAL